MESKDRLGGVPTAERPTVDGRSVMTTYLERTGRRPDFRVRHEWLRAVEGAWQPVQHMRCDFSYDGDNTHRDGVYMIWPEFEDDDGTPIPEGSPIPMTGCASMWIVSPELRAQVHRKKAQVGRKAYIVAGGTRLARAEIIELVGLFD